VSERGRRGWLPAILLIVAGALVFSPAIRAPLLLDDYFQTAMIEGTYPSPRSPFNLYDFVGNEDRALLLDRGLLPWWSHPRITVRFMRPLSSVLLYAERKLFGSRPLPSHLHSFAWWAAAALAALALYRRALGPRAGLLAAFIFGLASCHTLPLAWLAHREATVSMTFGILALGALVDLRDQGRARSAALATLFFGFSLLAGEYGLGFGGYPLALALASRRAPRGRRAWMVASFAIPATAYLLARAWLHYGTEGSGLYTDPFHEPVAFLERAPARLTTLLGEGWLTLDPDTITPTSPLWALALAALACVALLFVPVRRMLSTGPRDTREHGTWLLTGSCLAMVPMLSVMPSSRVLGASELGIAGVIALVLDRAWFPETPDPRSGAAEWAGLVAVVLGFAHLVHDPVTSFLTSKNFRLDAMRFTEHVKELRARVHDPAIADVVLVRGLSGSVFVLPYAIDARGTPPARWRILGLVGHILVLRRDARTIDVVTRPERGIFPIGEGNLFRGAGAPLVAGDVIRATGMKVTILDVGEAGPRRVRFEFDDALDAPSRVWIADGAEALTDATLPEPGFGKPFDP